MVAILSAALLSGCATGSMLSSAEKDTDIITSSVPQGPQIPAAEQDKISDQVTIRNAVSSANLEELNGEVLSWANQDTGSRGAVTAVREFRKAGRVCREFKASRESFEGVSLVKGVTCLGDGGQWHVSEYGPA